LNGLDVTDQLQTVPILEMRGISKRFPGVLALSNVDFSANRGEIHALIGQNGAGKSTLMKILAGDYLPTKGEILIDGQVVNFHHPRVSRAQGIAIVYQELSLLPNLSVAENIFLGREPGRYYMIDDSAIRKEAKKVLDQLGVQNIPVDQKLGTLPLAQQQLIEIAKALSFRPRILILDEPTAALTPQNVERLFEILNRLKTQGIAIIHITHRLKEIIEHCDRGTVLRNGAVVGSLSIHPHTSEEELIELMIGQEVESFFRHQEHESSSSSRCLLEVKDMLIGERVRGVSFQLRGGEILGITGLLGAGQNELVRAMFGAQPDISSGTILRNGKPVTISSPEAAIDLGIGLLTENRKEEGLFLDMSIKENITMPSLRRFLSRFFPLLVNSKERQAAQYFIDKVNVVLRTAEAKVRTLSGGNQQKAILARWLLRDLEVLMFIEPTRGIDVGAKAEIYRYLDSLAMEGRGIIVVSPDLTEILGVADRIIVVHEGKVVREFQRAEATEELLLANIQGATENLRQGTKGNGSYAAKAANLTPGSPR
jgi:ribose transport system ATP-binding protein